VQNSSDLKYAAKNWREKLLIGFGVGALFLCIGCSGPHSDSSDSHVLNRGLIGEPESLSPHHFSSNQSASILRDIGEGLVRYDASGALVAGVASSWSISQDGLVYVFNLRNDARWSNGDLVVANDFASAFRSLVTPDVASSNANNAEHILNAPLILRGESMPSDLGVYAEGPHVLKIRLHTQTPFFIQLLAHPSMFPIHQSSGSVVADDELRNFGVSNGAYQLSEWVVGSQIVLNRNSDYWNDDRTFFDKVVFHVVAESSELTRFRAGELDVTENVPSTMFKQVQDEYPDELRVAPYLGVYYYGFNLTNSRFADAPKLRRALSLAVDRELLVSKITGRGERAAYGWVPPGFVGYRSQRIDASEMRKHDREALAIRLYEESGFGPDRPLQFELRYNTSDVQQRIALAIQSMWREVLGADVTIVNEEFKVLISNIRAHEITEVFRLSWTGDYNDPQTFLKLFVSSNSSNLTGYSNARYDELMKLASTKVNDLERRTLLEEAESLMLADNPVLPLYFYVSKHLISTRIDGWEDNILDIHGSQYLGVKSESNLP